MSRRLQVALGVALAIGLSYLFLRQADLAAVWRALRQADPWLIGAAVASVGFNQWQRAWRWHHLLSPIASVPTRPLVDCTFIGWGVTLALPGRLGELARPVLLSQRAPVRASAAIGSIVLERAFDALTVLVLLAAYLAFLPPPTGLDSQGQLALDTMRTSGMLLLAALIVFGLIAVAAMRSTPVRELVGRLNDRLPRKIGELSAGFMTGLAGLRSPLLIAQISVHSLLLWANITFMYVLLFWAFDLQLPVYAAIPLVAVLVIGVIIPTPGAVGSFHAAAQIGLVNMWGVENNAAVAYAIVAHAVAFLPGVVGLAILARQGVSLGAMRELGKEPDQETAGAEV